MNFWVFTKVLSVNLYKNKSLRYLIFVAFYFTDLIFLKGTLYMRPRYCFVVFVSHMHVPSQNVIVVKETTTRISEIIENNKLLCSLWKIILHIKLDFENLVFNGFPTNIYWKKKVIKCIKTLFYCYTHPWYFWSKIILYSWTICINNMRCFDMSHVWQREIINHCVMSSW